MKDNSRSNKSLDEMTVKEALSADAANLIFRSSVISDPAPMPFVPITPIVIGKKVIKSAGKMVDVVKRKIR